MNNDQDLARQRANTMASSFGGPQPAAKNPAQAMGFTGFVSMDWHKKPIGKAGVSGKGSIGKHQSGGRGRGGRGKRK